MTRYVLHGNRWVTFDVPEAHACEGHGSIQCQPPPPPPLPDPLPWWLTSSGARIEVTHVDEISDQLIGVFRVGTEREARLLLVAACPLSYEGDYVSPDINEHGIRGIEPLRTKLDRIHAHMKDRGSCECHRATEEAFSLEP